MSDVSITVANVTPVAEGTTDDTVFGEGIAGEELSAGQPIFLQPLDNKQYKADANAAYPASRMNGIAMHAALAGQPIRFARPGCDVNIGATLTVGAPYWLSANAGGICPTADLTTGMVPVLVGFAKTASKLKVVGAFSGVALA